jgi:predicted TIM-barrel fold metal-dependent hydrolase
MSKPLGKIVDTLIGFRAVRVVPPIAALREADKADHHPHGYMFKDIPPELKEEDDPAASIGETLQKMDQFGIEVGLAGLSEGMTAEAVRRYPERFRACLAVDGNKGMDAVRGIVRAKAEHDIAAVSVFAAGVSPQLPLNDKHWYPIYAKCVELDLPVFCAVGVPGPRVPMMAQWPGHLDEVCYDFPELRLVMRHGAEPWADLAVKLMLKWPNLYYSTSGFAPKFIPKEVIDYANTRGAEKVLYAGYFPMGLSLERIFDEWDQSALKPEILPKFFSDNARKVLKLPG